MVSAMPSTMTMARRMSASQSTGLVVARTRVTKRRRPARIATPAMTSTGHERAGAGGEPPVGDLGDPDGVVQLGDQDADDVACDGSESPVVKDRAAPLEPALFLKLGRAAGPTELVVAVAPDVADHEGGERQVREDHPPEQLEPADTAQRRVTPRWMISGGAKGSRPTRSEGGPWAR